MSSTPAAAAAARAASKVVEGSVPLREPVMVHGVGRAPRWLPETNGSEKRSPFPATRGAGAVLSTAAPPTPRRMRTRTTPR